MGGLEVDLAGRSVTVDGTPGGPHTHRVRHPRHARVAHPGRVYTRMQLMEAAQGDAFEGYERTIDAHVKNVRRKLGDDPRDPRYIQTVFGVGYKLEVR